MKKKVFLLISLVLILTIAEILAINLEIKSEPIDSSFILELNEPAIFELTIKNNEESEAFSIYSLVGINITHEPLSISKGETKKIRIYLTPQNSLNKPKLYTFEYKIKNSKNEIQSDILTMNMMSLKSILSLKASPLTQKSEKATVEIKNNAMKEFKEINLKLYSPLFVYENKIALSPNEKKIIEIPIDQEKLNTYNAGNYKIDYQLDIQGNKATGESQINVIESEDIQTEENKQGSIIQKSEKIKRNLGNVKTSVTIREEKTFFASFFTTTNIAATRTEMNGLTKIYIWEKILNPNEELRVITKTNWFFPVLIIIAIIIGSLLVRKSLYDNLQLTKKVSFVKTNGGEFALKVTLKVRAKNKIENIKITDRIPHLVKLYNKFGIIHPNKIDIENRRLYWELPLLNKEETRIFTYIIYSGKIGVVGKFELPEANAIYKDKGELKEASSNRAYYIRDGDE